MKKVAFVVQRYGREIIGGAEQHCRMLIEHLKSHYDIEVLTTTARDYTTWMGPDDFKPGVEDIDGVRVRRFSVEFPRRERSFVWHTRAIHHLPHTLRQEEKWIEAQGPCAPALVRFVRDQRDAYDLFVFYSYRYYPAFAGASVAPNKSILVPTAEDDWTLRMPVYKPLLERVAGYLFLSEEERELLATVGNITEVKHEIIGMGIDLAPPVPFVDHPNGTITGLYVGRIDRNKGCHELLNSAKQMMAEGNGAAPNFRLRLIGQRKIDLPDVPWLDAPGFVSEEVKHAAMRECDCFIMPSPYESLSMATLEAMSLGKPILVNGACKVLAGHCRRSQGGWTWRGPDEFRQAVERLRSKSDERRRMGEAARRYVEENYAWPVVVAKCRRLMDDVMARGETL